MTKEPISILSPLNIHTVRNMYLTIITHVLQLESRSAEIRSSQVWWWCGYKHLRIPDEMISPYQITSGPPPLNLWKLPPSSILRLLMRVTGIDTFASHPPCTQLHNLLRRFLQTPNYSTHMLLPTISLPPHSIMIPFRLSHRICKAPGTRSLTPQRQSGNWPWAP